MKTRITLVRHAETKANQKRAFSGRKEVPVSDYGYQQIYDLTKSLKDRDYVAIYSSPMTRAVETVKSVAQHLKKEVEIDQDLLELSYGKLEGTPRNEIKDKFPEVWDFFLKYDYFKGVEGQEEIEDGAKRLHDCLVRLSNLHPGEEILVASHGMVIRAFFCLIQNIPWTEFMTTERIRNTAVNELEYDLDTGKFTILVYNNTDHEEIL